MPPLLKAILSTAVLVVFVLCVCLEAILLSGRIPLLLAVLLPTTAVALTLYLIVHAFFDAALIGMAGQLIKQGKTDLEGVRNSALPKWSRVFTANMIVTLFYLILYASLTVSLIPMLSNKLAWSLIIGLVMLGIISVISFVVGVFLMPLKYVIVLSEHTTSKSFEESFSFVKENTVEVACIWIFTLILDGIGASLSSILYGPLTIIPYIGAFLSIAVMIVLSCLVSAITQSLGAVWWSSFYLKRRGQKQ